MSIIVHDWRALLRQLMHDVALRHPLRHADVKTNEFDSRNWAS